MQFYILGFFPFNSKNICQRAMYYTTYLTSISLLPHLTSILTVTEEQKKNPKRSQGGNLGLFEVCANLAVVGLH